MKNKLFKVVVFEAHTYKVRAHDKDTAIDQVMSGDIEKCDACIDGVEAYEINNQE